MRLVRCDKCGDLIKDSDIYQLSDNEIGYGFLSRYKELAGLTLCYDCYEEFRDLMQETIDDFLEECNTYPYTEDGDYRGERR